MYFQTCLTKQPKCNKILKSHRLTGTLLAVVQSSSRIREQLSFHNTTSCFSSLHRLVRFYISESETESDYGPSMLHIYSSGFIPAVFVLEQTEPVLSAHVGCREEQQSTGRQDDAASRSDGVGGGLWVAAFIELR